MILNRKTRDIIHENADSFKQKIQSAIYFSFSLLSARSPIMGQVRSGHSPSQPLSKRTVQGLLRIQPQLLGPCAELFQHCPKRVFIRHLLPQGLLQAGLFADVLSVKP